MARYGIKPDRRMGVSVPDMRRVANQVGRDHRLALALWKTRIPDARIVASMAAEPEKLTERQMEEWVRGFYSWDVCDQVCMNLFDRTPLAWKKVLDWSAREGEFTRRAAFALIACLASHDRESGDDSFIELLPLIERAAVRAARTIRKVESRTARWIASDALRELTGEAVQSRL